MNNFIKILIFSLFAITTLAQQATEIDSKSVKLPRYADLTAIQASIPTAQQGMMVYNIGTASNWYFNGTTWTNTAGSLALPFSQTQASSNSLLEITNTYSIPVNSGKHSALRGVFSGNIESSFLQTIGNGAGIVGVFNGTGWVDYNSSGVFGQGIGGASGVIGETSDGKGVMGISTGIGNAVGGYSSTGTSGYFYTSSGKALHTYGALRFEAVGAAAGKVLTANDAIGNATWQNPSLLLPYNQTNNSFSGTNSQFEITNNGPGTYVANLMVANTAIKGTYSGVMANLQGSGIFGVFSGTGPNVNSESSSGILGIGINSASGVIGRSTTGLGVSGSSEGGIGGSFSSISGYALLTGTGNVGIGTPTPTAKLDVAGFTKLGDDANTPKIKMKELLTFNTASGASSGAGLTPPQSHGLTASKIISVSVLVNVTGDLWVPPVYTSDPRLNYNYFILSSNIYIQNSSTDCTLPGDHICGKPVKVLITYKE